MKLHGRNEPSVDADHFLRTLLWVFLLVNILSLVLYQFSNLKSDFFHEAAYPYLYAQSDINSNTIFNSQFSGREIAPISWTLISHLLLLLGFKLTFVTVAISNLIFLSFAVAIIVWFGAVFEVRKTQILLLLVLFTTIYSVRPYKYSWMDQVWIWPMNSYGIYEIFSLLLCICSYKMLTYPSKSSSYLHVFTVSKFYLIPFFLFGLNHNRGLLEIYGPVGFSLLAMLILNAHIKELIEYKRCFQVFLFTLIATILGRILIGILTLGVPQYWQQPSQFFTTLDQSNFGSKLLSPILTIFQVFGMSPVNGEAVVSGHGVKVLSTFALVVTLIFVPTIRYLQGRNFRNLPITGQIMFFHLMYFVLVAFLTAIFTNSAGVIRYFIPLAISALFFAPFAFSENSKKQTLYISVTLVFLVPNIFIGAKNLNEPLHATYRDTSNYLLTQSLLERNLDYGFAGPWTEDVLTIPFYSGGKIHVSLIDVAPIAPHLHADKSWFLESDHKGSTFVAFPTDSVLRDSKYVNLVRAADSEYVIDKWTVLIYGENPAKLIGQLP